MENIPNWVPHRRTTRRVTYINLLFSWLAVFLVIFLNVTPEVATTVITWAFGSNTVLLLIYTSRSFADKLAEKIVEKMP